VGHPASSSVARESIPRPFGPPLKRRLDSVDQPWEEKSTMRNSLGAAFLLAALLITPSAALATSKCICDNGKTLTTASDAEDACETSCDLFGGGHAAEPDDNAKGDAPDANRNPRHRSGKATAPAAAAPDGGDAEE
jgi:hypothetical protein